MKKTINQLNKELEAIADAHLMVNSYFWGDFLTAINSSVVKYPLMCCYYTGNGMARVTTPINLFVVIADKYFKTQREGNLNDTESDTMQVARDVFNVINKTPRWQTIGKVNSATFNKFQEKGADETAGGVLQISFTLYDNESVCDLPLQGYDIDSPLVPTVCADVLILNSDGSFSAESASGSTYTLPDETIDVYVNGILNQSATYIPLSNQTININA